MYTLKLYTDWISKAQEKIHFYNYIKDKGQNKSRMSKKQVKEIDKIIKTAEAIENTDEYIIYAIET